MKNKILILSIALGLCLSACQDFLTPEIKTDIALDTYGSTPVEANLLLNQAYVELRNDNITGSVFWQYFTTDYSVPPAGTSLARSLIAKLSYDAAEGDILNIWSAHYTAISRPNLLIEKADAALSNPDLSAADKTAWSKISGEARFIRAFLYFNLVRLYRNVPIVDQFFRTFDEINSVSNAPGSQMKEQENKVYAFITNDLTTAIAQLTESGDRGRANKLAAQALLGKVFLTQASIEKYRDKSGDGKAFYENALSNLNAVILSKKYALKTYFPDNFIRDKQNTGNQEALFFLEFNELDNSGVRAGLNTGFLNNSGSNVEYGTLAGSNGGQQATDFGWSVFDLNSPGDIVRRFWTFEEGEFRSFDANGNKTLQNTAADCPNGENCEIFLRTTEPYPWNRPYWFEIINDANAFRNNPIAPDVITNGSNTTFSIIWGAGNLNAQPGVRLVKYRRNPLTQPNYTASTWDGDLPVLRYAEVLLMYAEVANELLGPNSTPTGGSLTALQAVNQIRARARNFVYYPNLTVNSRIINVGAYKATYGDVFSRKAQVGNKTAPPKTDNAADTLAKYYYQISAFRGIREVPPVADIRNFKDFPATANWVPDFSASMTKEEFTEELLDERWRELAGEQNLRWFDLTRYGRLVNRVNEYKTKLNPLTNRAMTTTPFGTQVLTAPGSRFEYLPIPKSELDRNPKLNQNEGF
ncbi:MAG TPA: RagB/SusD family nutrient uptake outer membrane protein [Haliscomenobacter sp.]|uniref:RagB/SusD family nutrient uptake outer membrane protein n=1 Tax=Haliscomenobacter sp. TaxID=2717303 RepID=UPI002CD8A343|nr:RagB/SusD family nutrient uptake outer membrane protein [Haliscomenobacter sp.]HOY16226.1 RagB/SusD family nutrient uptake outer membrane protein [Haliscomenobacter sp.]HPH18267.1 RagB/SusD family nutrient uptake outer membrane protein [Haliscomenobacter sp.]